MTAYHGENLGKNKYYFDHGETLPRYLNASLADHPHPTHMGLKAPPCGGRTGEPGRRLPHCPVSPRFRGARRDSGPELEAQKYC